VPLDFVGAHLFEDVGQVSEVVGLGESRGLSLRRGPKFLEEHVAEKFRLNKIGE
jgi:hypothetical protein